jgi:hypothetical protein
MIDYDKKSYTFSAPSLNGLWLNVVIYTSSLAKTLSIWFADAAGQAAVWQNKRTGLFTFLGEHNGRPAYQNNATKEYLYYTFTGAEWLVGPDFRKPQAGNMMVRSYL